MTPFTAILIGTAIFASVYGGALANEHRTEPSRPISIEYIVTKPVVRVVAHSIPKPKPSGAYTPADLKSDQRTLYYALLSVSDEAVRKTKR